MGRKVWGSNPGWARFLAHVQTGPGAHASSSRSSGVKRSERGVDHPPPPSAGVKERVELYRYSPSGPSWPAMGLKLPFFYTSKIKQSLYWPRQTLRLPVG